MEENVLNPNGPKRQTPHIRISVAFFTNPATQASRINRTCATSAMCAFGLDTQIQSEKALGEDRWNAVKARAGL